MSDIQFGTLELQNGKAVVTNERQLSSTTIDSCPNVIFVPDHYHDGTCDCFDKSNAEMKELGYRWDEKKGHWAV
jgi:hypothetical protein